jgi:hypothetical protein
MPRLFEAGRALATTFAGVEAGGNALLTGKI